MERVTIKVEDLGPKLDFLHRESVKLDEKVIGSIGKNKLVDDSYCFMALLMPQWIGKVEYDLEFSGESETLIGAHNLAQAYANHLIAEGF